MPEIPTDDIGPGTVFDEYSIEYAGETVDVIDRITENESYVEEYHLPDGRVIRAVYRLVVHCEHCGHEWGTTSTAARPSCSACHRKTDRNVLGKHYDTYLKYALFNGEESSVDDVTARLRNHAELFELMEANGWRFDCTTQASHVALSKGDAPKQDIVA